MHYTPGRKIGGLTQINQAINAATDRSLIESATLLAKTMELSKDTKDVVWLTQRGGVGIFTQAMSILKSRGIDFDGQKHHVFFSHPTTNFAKAQTLAMEIGMNFERDNLSIQPLNPNELVGGLNFGGDFIAGYQRVRHDPEYTALNYGCMCGRCASINERTFLKTASVGAAIWVKYEASVSGSIKLDHCPSLWPSQRIVLL